MRPVFRTLRKVAPFDLSVLLTGPSGVGKTRMARALHEASDRKNAPFVVLECGSVPDALLESELFGHSEGAFTGAVSEREGVFRAAHGGTLLLDEVSAASAAMQVALLRALESQYVTPLGSSESIPVDVRIVATTAEDLRAQMNVQQFRPDLFYRLAVIVQELPSLDARTEDIAALAHEITAQTAKAWNLSSLSLDDAAIQALSARAWPGNIRELENVIKRAAAMAGNQPILPTHLAPTGQDVRTVARADGPTLDTQWIRSGPIAVHQDTFSLPVLRDALEHLAINRALEVCEQNQSKAAKLLDIPRRTLVYKLAQWRKQDDAQKESPEEAAEKTTASTKDKGSHSAV